MVISGVAMVIFDSRIIHNWIRKIRAKLPRNQQENIELGETVIPTQDIPTTVEQQSEPSPIPIDADSPETSVSKLNRQSQVQQDNNVENSPRVRSDEVKMPYSIRTGLVIFAFFVTSFIVVMVIRGVVHNSPIAYRLFANMYLAGTSQAFPLILICFRNHYLRY